MELGAQRYFSRPVDRRAGGIFFRGLLRETPGIPPDSPRTLDCFAFVYVFGGRGRTVTPGGIEREVIEGDLLILFPGVAHAYGGSPGDGWSEIFLMVRSPLFDALRQSGILTPELAHWHLGRNAYWTRRFFSFISQPPPQGRSSGMEELGKLIALLGEAQDSRGPRVEPQDEDWAAMARHLLADPELGMAEVARESGTSYESFRKRFKQETGLSPKQYRERHRIEDACRLLQESTLPVKIIADRVGYCDPFHFSKQFKRYTGMSPSEFRRVV